MGLLTRLLLFCLLVNSCTPTEKSPATYSKEKGKAYLQASYDAYREFADQTGPAPRFPRSYQEGGIKFSKSSGWTSGFYPGILWQLASYYQDESLRGAATAKSRQLLPEIHNKGTHDLGFMLFNGAATLAREDQAIADSLIIGAYSLASRYDPDVGCIKSWDFNPNWEFPVIIDNMMNLEYLLWAFEKTQDSVFYTISISHADKTLENHYRPDYSCYHVVNYDTATGAVKQKFTHQGANDESVWARGQSWGLYGFVIMYRLTRQERYLDHAIQIANYLLKHESLPEDHIPYWDFAAPEIPNEPRDVSAAAIMASTLLELAEYVNEEDAKYFITKAEFILMQLWKKYQSEDSPYILDHSVGSLPDNAEIDVPLIYADYYFIEAILRTLTNNNPQ